MAIKARSERLMAQLGFAGGVNLRDAPDEIGPTEATAVSNMVLTERGAAVSRLGCLLEGNIGSAGDRVLSMHRFDRETGGPQLIVHTTAGHVKYTEDLVNFTNIWTGMSATDPFSYETFNGKIYLSNGVDDFRSWNGAAGATYASAPKGKYIRLWQDTMYMAGIDGEPTQLRQSAAGDAETWPVSGMVQIYKDDGDPIMGLGNDGFFLVVLKRGRGFIVYDAALLSNRLIDYEKGCESHFSILNHENNLYYLSKFGIVRWTNQAPGPVISGRIDPFFDHNVINFSALQTSYAYRHEHRCGWAIPEVGNSFPSVQIEFYPHLPEQPFTFHRLPARTFVTWRVGTVDHLLGTKGSSNALLRLFDGDADDGQPFTSFIQTGWQNFEMPNNRKYLSWMRILGRGLFNCYFLRDYKDFYHKTRTINLPQNIDLWDATEAWDTNTKWGEGTPSPGWVDLQPDFYGRQFAFRFEGLTTGDLVRSMDVGGANYLIPTGQWGINDMVLHAKEMGDRL